jgi:predicted kinase
MVHDGMEAVIFIGIQGSGKSSFFRERFFDSHVRINLDMLRTRRREELLVAACLEGRQSFVVDNTNPLPVDRARYVARARAAGFRTVAYFFDAGLREAMARNNLRAGKQRVPAMAVAATFKKLVAPSADEGFDEIYTVKLTADGGFVTAKGSSQE